MIRQDVRNFLENCFGWSRPIQKKDFDIFLNWHKTMMILVQYKSNQEFDVCIGRGDEIVFIASNMKFDNMNQFRNKVKHYL